MKWINWILLAILGIWFALMGLFNSTPVMFHYALGERELPLVVVMLICFIFGALLTLLVFGVKSLYWKSRSKSLERQLDREHRAADDATIKAEFEQAQKV